MVALSASRWYAMDKNWIQVDHALMQDGVIGET